jgi:glycosyltransferase involved in cell wall biosynthesis
VNLEQRTMKVLIITASLNERSGWGRYSREVIDGLIARGVEVVVCARITAGVAYPVHQISELTSIFAFLKNVYVVRNAARNVDVVHALDGWPYGVYGWLALLGRNKKLCISGVGTYSVAPLYYFFKGWLLRRAYRRASKIFCISDFTKQELITAGIPEDKLLTVHMGASPLPEISASQEAQYRERYAIAQTRAPILLTVGSIEKARKGQLETLKAVEILKRKHPNILYIAVGSAHSHYAESLRSYADAHELKAHFLIVSNTDDLALSFFYSISDIFALNSINDPVHHHFEGFGLVIIEAYQFGKPAVGSSGCGIEDAIVDGQTGFLTRQRDPQDIAMKIDQILGKYEFFSRSAKMHHADFTWEKTVDTYIRGYQDI